MTLASAPDPDGARIVRLPPPTVPVASIQGTLALELGPRLDVPEPDLALPPARRSAGPDGAGPDLPGVDLAHRRRFERHAARICAAVVEVVGGDRPVSQLVRWASPEVYHDLARRAHLVAAAAGRRPGAGGVQSVRPQLVGVRTCFVTGSCAEVSLRVRYGPRSRAVAARFELLRDRWQITALEFA
ncbi:MAG TPA: Rv3235 family protein [Nocardioides sp.]|uniref:Rv3235 family protein n=1 Tax=Nocardioides sp. TaxID=35761 RepID=UPI002E3302D1|nr:Rv3235 family protein [Nocardioides sp.]HEX3932382.1 Rv3235 family protein [Nocardioides sp.]